MGHPNFGTPVVDSMLELINAERTRVGLHWLVENSQLEASAHIKACDLLNKGYWSHTDLNGDKPWKLITEQGYSFRYAGENLCRFYLTDGACMNGLMQSPTHKANILEPKFKEIGIGRCGGYIVQHYGSKN